MQEYLAAKAVLYYNLWKEGPNSPNTQLSEERLGDYQTRLAINGRYGTRTAVESAYIASGGESTVGFVLAGGLTALGQNALFRSPGINGNPDHQATVEQLKQMAKKEFEGRNVEIRVNKSIKQWLGIDRRPDVSVVDKQTRQLLKVYEAARVDMSGNFVPREQQKMFEYWEAGTFSYWFEEVK